MTRDLREIPFLSRRGFFSSGVVTQAVIASTSPRASHQQFFCLCFHHGDGMTQKGRKQLKEWKESECGECRRWTWCGSKCWHCGSNGYVEPKGRILGDTANLENASKDDITATLRYHESLQKSMTAGAPAAARDAIAAKIKQAVYAKEPVHVQLMKVQAALTRAEEVAEKKHGAVWATREAADRADQHVLNLRQRMDEFTEKIYVDADAPMAEEQWGFGEWHEAGGISRAMVCRPCMVGRRQPLGRKQTEPRAACDSVGVCFAKSVSQEGGRPESGSPWCKVPGPADRGQRGRVDCWHRRVCSSSSSSSSSRGSVRESVPFSPMDGRARSADFV